MNRATLFLLALSLCCGSVTARPTDDGGSGGAGGKVGLEADSGGQAGAASSGTGGSAIGTGGVQAIGGVGGMAVLLPSYTFDSSLQGFSLPGEVAGSGPTISHSSVIGQGSPAGCIQVDVDFTDFQQHVDVLVMLAPIDLSHATINAAVNGKESLYGGGFLFVKSAQSATIAGATGQSLTTGSFATLSLDVGSIGANIAGFDPTLVDEIGVRIYTKPATDGGTFPGPGSYTIYIDNIIATAQ